MIVAREDNESRRSDCRCPTTAELSSVKRALKPQAARSLTPTGAAVAVRAPMPRGRFESELREAFDDGWESLGELEPFKTDVLPGDGQEHHLHQRQPRHQLRPVHQPLSRLRARLHLLLRAADPLPTSAIRPGSTSRPSSTPRSTPPSCWSASSPIPRYVPKYIALGAVTDPYQPIEREHRITRSILEVLERASHPVGIVTKSALVVRDIDILARMAGRGLVKVAISVTTLDRRDRPQDGAARGHARRRRLEAIRALSARRRAGRRDDGAHRARPSTTARSSASWPPRAMPAPREAGYVLLRLPLRAQGAVPRVARHRVPGPRRARHQHPALHARRQGLHARMAASASAAAAPTPSRSARRFRLATKRLGLNERTAKLRTDLFQRPVTARRAAPAPLTRGRDPRKAPGNKGGDSRG